MPDRLSLTPDALSKFRQDLEGAICGSVQFDALSRAAYATDASLYRIPPVGVVAPRDEQDVREIVRICAAHRVPIVARGAGTGIAGGAVGAGLQVDFSRCMHAIGPVDEAGRRVTVQPGVVLDVLNAHLAPYGLMFAPDVASSSRATLGGMIANNSSGAYSVRYGRTCDHLVSLDVVLADGSQATFDHLPFDTLPGEPARPRWIDAPASSPPRPDTPRAREIYSALDELRIEMRDEVVARWPRVLRRNGGYALDRLCFSVSANPATVICGSEGALALVTQATLGLIPTPRHRGLVVIQFHSVLDALSEAPRLLEHEPAAIELVDHKILAAGAAQADERTRSILVGCPPAILICELHDDDAGRLARRLESVAKSAGSGGFAVQALVAPDAQQAVWTLRKRGFGLLASRPGTRQPHEFIEDAAVPPERVAEYIARLSEVLREIGAPDVAYYAHASVGVIHVRPVLNLDEPADVDRLRRIAERTAELVIRLGGAVTGEHGDGLVRSEWLRAQYGPVITHAFRRLKQAFDPENLLNPGKIIDAPPMHAHLRPAPTVNLPTKLDFREHGGLAGMARMCTGVGQCRQTLVGVMCPSYMATLDERATTRARAQALRDALTHGSGISGLDDDAVHAAMDLCLMCKACKSECPTGVDLARMKAEWLWQVAQQRGVRLGDRIIAAAPRLAQLGSLAPRVANRVLGSGVMRRVLRAVAGLEPRIAAPRLANETFRAWWNRNLRRGAPGFVPADPALAAARATAVYFVDTWTNYYWPSAGIAAVKLLLAGGFQVAAPPVGCCGRTYISKGLLDQAGRMAKHNVNILSPWIETGAHVVGSEPSCALTLVDEYPRLLASVAAQRLAQRSGLVDALLVKTEGLSDGREQPKREVRLHAHCHQRALAGTSHTLKLLRAAPGVQAEELNTGCCGMAGSFGHEAAHYDVARLVGEQRLFPAVRALGEAQIAVTGFSCREQIEHHTGVAPRHVLEIVADAMGLLTASAGTRTTAGRTGPG